VGTGVVTTGGKRELTKRERRERERKKEKEREKETAL